MCGISEAMAARPTSATDLQIHHAFLYLKRQNFLIPGNVYGLSKHIPPQLSTVGP